MLEPGIWLPCSLGGIFAPKQPNGRTLTVVAAGAERAEHLMDAVHSQRRPPIIEMHAPAQNHVSVRHASVDARPGGGARHALENLDTTASSHACCWR